MKRVALVCAMVLVVAVVASRRAHAQGGLCFVGRCDCIQIDSIDGKRIEAQWLFYDCANNTPMTGGLIARGLVPNACPGGNGNAIIACLARDTCGQLLGGDWFFVLDSLDGTLDLNMGDPLGEHTCAIDEMPYTLTGF